MALDITYAELEFKYKSNTSDAISEPPAAPKEETSPRPSNRGLPKRLLVSLLILLLLLAISFFIAFIIFFQGYSQLLKEKKNSKEVFHEKLKCEKAKLDAEGKGWGCCPESWVFNTSCYFISSEAKNWTESEKNCVRMGAHLLVINTKEEQILVTQKLQARSAYYLGLSDPEGTRQWRWVDQSPYNTSVTFWRHGEPSSPKEHCVVINSVHGKWGWNDVLCSGLQKSICEMMKIYLEHSP